MRLRKVKNVPVRGKISEVDSGLYGSKRKNQQFGRINLPVENLLNGGFYQPNVCHYGFNTQSLM